MSITNRRCCQQRSQTSFFAINTKKSDAAMKGSRLENNYISADDSMHILVYQENRRKLAWTLLRIMNHMHMVKLIHNDIGPINVLLHFPPEHRESISIGICDLRMVIQRLMRKHLAMTINTWRSCKEYNLNGGRRPQSYFISICFRF